MDARQNLTKTDTKYWEHIENHPRIKEQNQNKWISACQDAIVEGWMKYCLQESKGWRQEDYFSIK